MKLKEQQLKQPYLTAISKPHSKKKKKQKKKHHIVTGKYKFIIYTHQKMNTNAHKLTMTREENRKEKGEKILTKRNAFR